MRTFDAFNAHRPRSKIEGMRNIRINLSLAWALVKDLDRLAARYGFDRTNAIRYCIRTVCDAELLLDKKTGKDEAAR